LCELRRRDQRIDRLLRLAAGTQQGKPAWSKSRIGAMLGQHGANAGLAPGDARADGDR